MRLGSILILLFLSYFFNPVQPIINANSYDFSFDESVPIPKIENLIDASVIQEETTFLLS